MTDPKALLDYGYAPFDPPSQCALHLAARRRALEGAWPPAPADARPETLRRFALETLDRLPAPQEVRPPLLDTAAFLAGATRSLARDGRLALGQNRILDAIRHKFEVSKRVFAGYADQGAGPGEGDERSPAAHGLLAAALLLRFALERNFNDLNSALKLGDLLAHPEWAGDGPLQPWATLPLRLELALLEDEHGR